MEHNTHVKLSRNYSIVDELAQSPTTMSILEVLQTCPSHKKSLLTTSATIDPLDSHHMTFDSNQSTLIFPSLINFKIPITIKNIFIYQCGIDNGASTCVMSIKIWKDLDSPTLVPLTITFRPYDGWPSHSQGLYQNVPYHWPKRKP